KAIVICVVWLPLHLIFTPDRFHCLTSPIGGNSQPVGTSYPTQHLAPVGDPQPTINVVGRNCTHNHLVTIVYSFNSGSTEIVAARILLRCDIDSCRSFSCQIWLVANDPVCAAL